MKAAPLLVLLLAASSFAQNPPLEVPAEPARGPTPVAPAVPPKASVSPVGPGYTLIPLPAFSYNRNEGSWVGVLTPLFRANTKGEVEDIIAPLYLHNEKIGETFTINYFGYRRETRQFHAILSHATKIEHTADFGYSDSAAGNRGQYIFRFQGDSGKSAFNRFYGFGDRSTSAGESIYALGDSNLKLAGGLNLEHHLSFIAQERLRDVDIADGATDTLPQATAAYPKTAGIPSGSDIWGQSVTLQHDTRDNSLTPLKGDFVSLTAAYNQDFQLATHPKWARFTADGRWYVPHRDDRAVLVVHGLIDSVVGQVARTVPFYERPTLGGETTLRGFGRGRFVSNSAVLLNIEERLSLERRAIMGNQIELEVAPFLDIGRTARSVNSDGTVRFLQFNPGVGVRVLARPNIAGRLDVAYGQDGANVFVGLDYPF